jgi:putative Mg2+ transporter-C (MgtC) family protein
MVGALNAPTIDDLELALRLVSAAVLCGAVGFERETRGQAAGLRTHILVGVGSALFTLVSAYGFPDFFPDDRFSDNVPRPDPTRIAAQIVTGVGFLGAGAIIRQGAVIRGLTTAASLWIAAAIGMACGAGYYAGAAIAAALAVAVLWGLKQLRPVLLGRVRPGAGFLELDLDAAAPLEPALAAIAQADAEVESIESTREGDRRRVVMELLVPAAKSFDSLASELGGLQGVRRVRARGARKDPARAEE